MSSKFRTFGKIGFLLVIIGFFMPVACDGNGFEIAKEGGGLGFALYGLFVSAIAGVIVGVLLLARAKVPVLVDWVIVVACACCGFIPFFYYIDKIDLYQVGVYVMLTGSVFALLFQIISANAKET